jgi:adenine-specific DNA-methyltransferase
MGAKHHLAPDLARIIADLPDGPCLDLFAGMCSVAAALANVNRPAWANDVQEYSALVARAILRRRPPPDYAEVAQKLFTPYARNVGLLRNRFGEAVEAENRALESGRWNHLRGLEERWLHSGNDASLSAEVSRLRRRPRTRPYRLSTLVYSHGYFGLAQAIDLDSVRYAIDDALEHDLIDSSARDWLLVALLAAASHLSAAPGHFAQFLHVRDEHTFAKLARLRRRSVWQQFLGEVAVCKSVGNASWRRANRVFRGDALRLLNRLKAAALRPTIIYADPPYSEAQYSRYYHVLETLVRYDYPNSEGLGRCRSDRFATPFSHAAKVESAFHRLASLAADAGAVLVMSYPSNGLLFQRGVSPVDVLRVYFRRVETVLSVPARHSTLGASPGRASSPVTELVFVATAPRG